MSAVEGVCEAKHIGLESQVKHLFLPLLSAALHETIPSLFPSSIIFKNILKCVVCILRANELVRGLTWDLRSSHRGPRKPRQVHAGWGWKGHQSLVEKMVRATRGGRFSTGVFRPRKLRLTALAPLFLFPGLPMSMLGSFSGQQRDLLINKGSVTTVRLSGVVICLVQPWISVCYGLHNHRTPRFFVSRDVSRIVCAKKTVAGEQKMMEQTARSTRIDKACEQNDP